MVKVFVPLIVTVAPALIVNELQTPSASPIVGWFGAPAGIITSVVDVGTTPHQLLAVFQSVLVVPSQVPVAFTFTVKLTHSVVLQVPSARR